MLRDYDLNLLTVFDSVMKLGSVSKAADKLGMTSAAVSQNLSRLREQVGDPLFIRQGRGLQPTQYALNMHKHVAEGLSAIRFGLETDAVLILQPVSVSLLLAVRAISIWWYYRHFCKKSATSPRISR